MSTMVSVRSRYPRAVALFEEPIAELAQDAPILPEQWVVFESGDPGAEELGRGETEDEAWDDAARNVER